MSKRPANALVNIPPNHPSWRELHIVSRLSNTDDDIRANIEHTLTLGLPSLQALMGTKQGAIAIVGSGPSLKENWKELRRFNGDILACNAAFQFLLERGITATYSFCFDADPLMLEFITPVPGVKYLIGSRVPPKTWELLKDCDVVCWHANGDTYTEKLLQDRGLFSEPMVNGGTAAVTRAMMMAPFLGYTEEHLYGADSSYLEDDTHIRKSTTDEKWMHVRCAGRVFWCAPWMSQQAEDFKILVPQLKERGITIKVHGDGLIPHIARTMERDEREVFKKFFREFLRGWTHKATILWQHV